MLFWKSDALKTGKVNKKWNGKNLEVHAQMASYNESKGRLRCNEAQRTA